MRIWLPPSTSKEDIQYYFVDRFPIHHDIELVMDSPGYHLELQLSYDIDFEKSIVRFSKKRQELSFTLVVRPLSAVAHKRDEDLHAVVTTMYSETPTTSFEQQAAHTELWTMLSADMKIRISDVCSAMGRRNKIKDATRRENRIDGYIYCEFQMAVLKRAHEMHELAAVTASAVVTTAASSTASSAPTSSAVVTTVDSSTASSAVTASAVVTTADSSALTSSALTSSAVVTTPASSTTSSAVVTTPATPAFLFTPSQAESAFQSFASLVMVDKLCTPEQFLAARSAIGAAMRTMSPDEKPRLNAIYDAIIGFNHEDLRRRYIDETLARDNPADAALFLEYRIRCVEHYAARTRSFAQPTPPSDTPAKLAPTTVELTPSLPMTELATPEMAAFEAYVSLGMLVAPFTEKNFLPAQSLILAIYHTMSPEVQARLNIVYERIDYNNRDIGDRRHYINETLSRQHPEDAAMFYKFRMICVKQYAATIFKRSVTEAVATTITEPAASTITEAAATTITEATATTMTEALAASTITEAAATTIIEAAATTITEPAASTITEPAASTITEAVATTITELATSHFTPSQAACKSMVEHLSYGLISTAQGYECRFEQLLTDSIEAAWLEMSADEKVRIKSVYDICPNQEDLRRSYIDETLMRDNPDDALLFFEFRYRCIKQYTALRNGTTGATPSLQHTQGHATITEPALPEPASPEIAAVKLPPRNPLPIPTVPDCFIYKQVYSEPPPRRRRLPDRYCPYIAFNSDEDLDVDASPDYAPIASRDFVW